jgi:hypothetical protein
MLMHRLPILSILTYAIVACGQEPQRSGVPAKTPARANIIRAYFNTPVKSQGKFDGFWSVDAKEFAAHINKNASHTPSSANATNTRYFLRIEGQNCDELYFIDGGDFTMSAGTLKKLETAKGRTAQLVVFNRELPGGARIAQGAIITMFHSEKRLVLDFTDHKLTFFPEREKPSSLAERFTAGF